MELFRRTAVKLRFTPRLNQSSTPCFNPPSTPRLGQLQISSPFSSSSSPERQLGRTRVGPSFFTVRPPARPSSHASTARSPPAARRRPPFYTTAAAGTGAALFALLALSLPQTANAEAPPKPKAGDTPADATRYIRLSEVREHGRNSEDKTYWIMRGDRVYDVTEWVPNHPGGDVILTAVGGAVDPFWKIFSIHNKQEVYDILEQYYVGLVDPRDLVDGKVPQGAVTDPFEQDPARDARLHVHTAKPCNAETPAAELAAHITPNHLFYVRNHFWVPDCGGDEHRLVVELPDGEEVVYTVADLKRKFEPHTITSVLQCSGNRRAHMTEKAYRTNGVQWNLGAIGNAEWTGARLRDVLRDAGLDVDDPPPEARHAVFGGAEAYAASIPIEKALERRGDVLLAYAMNGEPLPADHGYPLRALVPGTVAARSVKWLSRVSLSDEESPSQWQRRDYKCFGPNEGSSPDWESAPSIQELPVQSAITSVREVNCLGPMSAEDHKMLKVFGLEEDCVKLEGYAYSGGGRRIVRVDVSADDGRTWAQAELLEGDAAARGSKSWGWQRWRIGVRQRQCTRGFLVKAVDDAYNSQGQDYESQWNYRGNLTNAWHRVPYEDAKRPADRRYKDL